MKVRELIVRLGEFDPDQEIMILDGFNGGGNPRELNLGPTNHCIREEDANEVEECEGRVGEKVVVAGFGCY